MRKSGVSVGTLGLSSKDDLDGIAYSRDTIEQLYSSICRWLRGDRASAAMVGYVNPHVFNLAKTNEDLRTFLATADIVAVDGLGLSLAVRVFKGQRQTRTVMTPLFDRVLETRDVPHLRAILVGSTETISAKAAAAMNAVAGRIRIVEALSGYLPLEDYLAILRRDPAIDVVLAAMGSPRSEELLLAASRELEPKLFWNIGGGTLHFYAGTQTRVPRFVSSIGMQWLWRILHQPTIAPRYLLGIPRYLGYLAFFLVSRKKSRPTIYENPHRQSCLQNTNRE